MNRTSRLRSAALAAALSAAAAAAFAAGTKTSGTVSVVDDLTGGSSGSALMTGSGVEVEGALGQTAVGTASSGLTESGGGFFAPAVTAPANVLVTGVEFSSITLGWNDAAPANPAGTLYVVELSTAADFTGTLVSSQTVGFTVNTATLSANATHYIRVRAEFGGAEASPYVFLSTVSAIEGPATLYFDEISSSAITASAFSPGAAFSSMTAGLSGVNIAIGGVYQGWNGEFWNGWGALGTPRNNLKAVALRGRIYVVGGKQNAPSALHALNEAYDPATNGWTSLAPLGQGRHGHAVAAAGGLIYAAGGSIATGVTATAGAEVYDPEANVWTPLPSMPAALYPADGAGLDGKVYVHGGSPDALYRFDPDAGSWSVKTGNSVQRGEASLTALGEKLYLTGGGTSSLEEYSPDSDVWTGRASMTGSPDSAAAAAAGGKLVVVGGFSGTFRSEVEAYDPGQDVWVRRTNMPSARANLAAAFARGRLHVVGGWNGADIGSNEAFNPGVSAAFPALNPNAQYSFNAKARNSIGVETAATLAVSTYTLAVATLPRSGDPAFISLTASSVTVTWSSGTDVGGFNGPGASYLAQTSTMPTFIPVWDSSRTFATSAGLAGLMTQTTHYFRVRAYNSLGVTDYSWAVLGSTRADYVPPNAPGEVTASVMGASNTLRVRWRTPGNDGALGVLPAGSEFRVQWATGPFASVDWSTANAQVVIATGPLNPGILVSTDVAHLPRLTTATFRVWAADDFGNWSLASGSAPMTVSPFSYEKVTGDGVSAGESAGMAMDRLGNLHVVYKDATLPGLKYVKRESGVWQAPTTAFPGTVNSIVAAVDPDGVVHAAYYNVTAGEMAYARYDGSWSSATVHVLATAGPGGIVVDPRGLVMISYSDYIDGDLRFAWGSGKTWTTDAVDTAGLPNNGVPSALALDASGNPRIAYTLPTGGSSAYNLKYAVRGPNGQWTLSEIRPQAENLSQPTLNLDANGLPRITYYRYSGVDSVFYVTDTGSGWIPPVLIGKTTNGLNSATMDGNGGLHVAYYLQPGDDLVYSYSGDGGASWSSHTVDMDGLVGYPVQPIAVDGDGAVHIVYHDQSNVDIKTARWEPGAHGPAFGGRPGSAVQAPTAFDGHALGASSITFRWIDGASNELGYRVYLSSKGSVNEAFSLSVASAALGPVAGVGSLGALNLTGLTANTSYQAYVAAVGNGGVVLSSASKVIYMPIEAPEAVLFEQVSTRSITAAAYAPGPAFSSMTAGLSGTNIEFEGTYQGWRGERWTARFNMPTSRRAMAAVTLGGKVYALAGVGGSGTLNQEYDPAADSWATRAPMSTVREAPAAAAVGGKIYVVGGWTGSAYTGATEEYDPAANEWTSKAVMPLPRYKLMAVALGQRLHAIGGFNGAWRNQNHVYDPVADVWSSSAPMLTARGFAAAVVVAGKLHVIGGDNDAHLAVNEAFDPGADSWSTKAPAPTARSAGAGAAAGGKAFVFGGWAGAGSLATVEEYDVGADTWTTRSSMPTARREIAAASSGGRIYVLGGLGGLTSNEEFDPGTTSSFTALTPNTSYSFRAKARNALGTETVETAVFSTFTLAAATAAQGGASPFAPVYATSMTVAWSSGTDAGGYNGPGASYLLQASTMPSFSPVAGSSLTFSTTAVLEGLAANATHFLRVRATNSGGVAGDWFSLGSTVTLANPALSAAATYTMVGLTSMTVTWDGNSNAPGTRYDVVFTTYFPFNNVVTVSTTPYGTPSATGTGLLTNATYYPIVFVFNRAGVSSGETPLGSTATRIETPSTVLVTVVTSHSVVAVASSPVGAFSNLDQSSSAVNIARDDVYQDWVAGSSVTVSSGLTPNTLYSFKAKARNLRAVETDETTAVSTYTLAFATIPAGGASPFTDVFESSVAVRWASGTATGGFNGPGATYRVEASTTPTFLTVHASSTTAFSTATVTGLAWRNTTFYFRVTAFNATGADDGTWTLLGATVTTIETPTSVELLSVSSDAVVAVATAAGTGFSNLFLGTSAVNIALNTVYQGWVVGSSVTVSSGLVPNSLYFFKARARGVAGLETAESGSVSTRTLAAVPLPGSPAVYEAFVTSASVQWTANNNPSPATEYRVHASTAEDFNAGASSSVVAWVTGLSTAVTGLIPYTTWYFRVQARNVNGRESDYALLGSTVPLLFRVRPIEGTASDTRDLVWGDFDRDGDLDLAAAVYNGGAEFVLRDDGAGPSTYLPLAGTAGDSLGVAWGDYDGDGDLDLAVANDVGQNEVVGRNDGGSFTAVTLSGTAGNSSAVAWGDYDRDGDLDLAIANKGTQDEVVMRNDGGGNFAKITVAGSGRDSHGVAWGDFDGDGDLDLLVANSAGENETLLRYDGGNSFAVVDLAGTGGNSRSVAAADFDGDGDLDFAVANELDDDYVARNDGSGTFARTDLPGTNGYSLKAAWGDYDGDGDLDLAVSNYNGAENYLARNAAGVFSTITVFGSAGYSWGLAWGDSDQDGALDLAAGQGFSAADSYLLVNQGGVVNSSPMAPGAPAYSLAYGVSGTTLTVNWPPSFDAETSTGGLSYALVAATAPMTLSGDGRRILSPASFLVSWNYGSPLFGANARPQSVLRLDLGGLASANLKSDATYYFRLQTVDAGLARSSWSVESSTFVYKDLPPQGRGVAAVNASSITVSLTAVGAARYLVEASSTNFAGGVAVSSLTLSSTVLSLSPQGLVPNTTYYLRAGGLWQRTTSYAATVPASTATLANAPATAVTTFTAVHLSSFNVAWSSNSNPAPTEYRLETSTASDWSGQGDVISAWFTGTSTAAVGLTPNATAYVRVQARNHSGIETDWTALGSTVTGAAKPAPPAGSSFTAVAQTSVTLAWGLGTNPADTQFQVRASTASDFTGLDAFSAWLAAQTTTLSGLTADTTYHWRVTARNRAGLESEARDFGAQATAPYDPAPSSAPYHDVGSSSAAVQWRPNGNPAGTVYEAQLSTSAAFGGEVLSSGWVAFVSTTVSGLRGDSTYYLRARARGVGGTVTDWTVLASSPTLAADPGSLSAASVGPGALRAEWGSQGNREADGLGPWSARTSLPAALERQGAALLNGRLYTAGGVKGGAPTAEVWSAGASLAGTLGPWRREADLPAPRESHGVAAFGGRLYVVGGFDGSAKGTVYSAEVSPDGRIAGWNTDSSLPAARSKLAVVAHAGWLYAIGGDNGVVSQSTVYRTAVDAKGKLVGWAAAAALPAARNSHAAAVSGGRVYVAGGLGAGVEEEVWSAALTGPSVGPWTVETPLPAAVFRHALLASGGALLSVGGHDGTGAVAAVRAARLLAGGVVGVWETLDPLPAGRFGHGAALETGNILVAGGADDSAAVADAYQAALGGSEYLLERAQDAGFSVDYASSNWRAGAGAELAGLTPNSQYFLRVRVRSRAGAEGGLVVSASTRTPAAVPASAASTFSLVEAGSMTLTWASGGNPPGTEFLAALSTSVDFTTSLNTGWAAALSSAVFGLTPNTSYFAGVVARDAGGSNTREVSLGSTVTAAAVPESPFFPSVVTTGLTVEWSTAGNPSGTLYEAQLAAAASFSPLAASTVTTSTGTAFTGLLSASTYYFRVRAYNRLATPTGFSPTTSAVTGADFTAPAAAGGLGLHASETPGVLLAAWTSPGDDGGAGVLPAGSRVYLQWSAADPASVAWSTASAQLSAATGPVTPGAPASLVVTGLPAGSSVYARVWTLDESDNVSAPSVVASVWASPFTLTRLDGTGQDAGRWVSAALDRQGNAHAAYTAGTITQELRYMTRSGGVWSVAEAPDPGIPAEEVVLAMGPSYPQAVYRNSTTGQLRLAKRASGWSAAAVASGDLHPGGLAVDATSFAHVSYYDADGVVGLRYARWNGASWDLETVDAGAGRGRFSSLALDGASAPHIAYYDAAAGDLKYASRTAAGAWATSTVEAAVDAGSVPVVALDGNGYAVIAYVDSNSKDLKLARFDGTAWSLAVVDAARDVTGVRGLALDAAGRAIITYYDGTNGDLLLGRYNGTGWETGAVDSYGDVGAWSSLALESDGSVLELHYEASSADLKAGTWNAGLGAALAGNPRGRSQAPAAFSGVVASSVGIQWTWADSASAELGWRLYGATASTGPFSVIVATAVLPATAGTGTQRLYTETGLTSGTTYYRYVAAVSSGGVVPSPMAALFPFDTVDVTPPTATDNQAGSAVWRRSSGTVYDVDFQDTGGSALTKFQVKAATVPGGTGPDVVAYTDVVVNILADSYTADWALPAAVFTGLHDGATNYLSVRVFDGAGNTGVLADVFTVLKDTTPPTLADNQAGDAVRRAAGGTLYDVDAGDPASGLERFQYSVSTSVASGDAARVGWTDVPLGAGATSYVADWAVDFAALLGDSPNYVSVRAWDRAGSTSTLTDAFIVLKDTGGPLVAMTAPAAAFRSVLTVLAGTAADDAGVGGVQVAVQTAPPAGDWFDGSAFTAGGPFWLEASGTATWTFAGVPAWTDGGAFRVVARATDTLGNLSVAYSTADFTFDASTPTAGVTSPADGATLAVLANLAGTASDPGGAASGLARIDVVVRRAADGFYWGWSAGSWAAGESSTSPAVSATWSLPLPEALRSTLGHGASYFVTARAVDGAVPANTGSLVSGSTFSWTDTTAPSAVTNLSALTGAGPGILSLTWTAPGDDGGSGDVSLGSYRIHYSTVASTVFSSAAAQVEFSTSGVRPGALQGRLVTGLTAGATYHARVFMADDAGNWSALSNGATAYAGNQPFNKIIGHVMKASSEGITAVKLEAYDSSEVRVSQAFSLADGSGTFSLDGVPDGVFRVLASWTADDITSSVWLDNIAVGSFDVDFMLEINYSLSTLTGTLSSLAAQTAARPGFLTRAAENNFAAARVDLLRAGEPVAAARPDPTGRWNIPNLLPGRYAVRAFNGLDYTDPQDVQLGEGETREVVFVFDPLPEASVFAFPNPARTRTTFRLISALPDMEAEVTVFDIAGTLVKEIPGSAFVPKPGGLFHADWDLTNDQGEAVASGVYLFMVKVKGSNGQTGKVVKKLAVVR